MDEGFRSPLYADANAGAVAIVTGGGTGIGRATALELGEDGGGRRDLRPPPRAAGGGPRADSRRRARSAWRCPATSARPSRSRRSWMRSTNGSAAVDILVNNAGGQFAAPLEAIALKGMRAVHRLNVDATWDVTQRVAERWMIPRRHGVRRVPGVQPPARDPDDDPLVDGAVGARDVRGGIAEEWSTLRDPRGVRRRRVDPDRGHPAVRRPGGRRRVRRRMSRSGGPACPRRSPRRSRSSPRPAVATSPARPWWWTAAPTRGVSGCSPPDARARAGYVGYRRAGAPY